jgi:beta-lactamase superfamily II metal-dependent hydrolase
MLQVEMLPAGYGDALLVSWGAATDEHHMLIDGGLASAYRPVAARLERLPGDIDLMVVTHVDRDHIAGALRLLNDDAVASRVKEVWFNGYRHLEQFNDILGPLDGEALSELIEHRRLAWNRGWANPVSATVGGPVVVDGPPPEVTIGGATLRILSPTPRKMRSLLREWTRTITRAGLVPGKAARPDVVEPGSDLLGSSLADLADTTSTPDDAAANGSSIAFVFEFDGRRILFGADAHSDALVAGLTALGAPYRLDACKLPHHGSRRNVSAELIRAVDCSQWWFSSNGVRFGHPNDEAVARVIRLGQGRARLVGNYRSPRWEAFTTDFDPAVAGYDLLLPEAGTEGITITF